MNQQMNNVNSSIPRKASCRRRKSGTALIAFALAALSLFGGACTTNTGDPGLLLLGSKRLSVYFNDPGIDQQTGSDKKIDQELVTLIQEAQVSVDLAVYNLGRDSIIEAMTEAKERGLKVRMVGDVDEVVTDGYRAILRTDIPFSLGNSSAIQHNKYAVIDKKYVFTGTGNQTNSGYIRNNNNYLIIESETLADSMTKEFEQMFFGRYGSKKAPFSTNVKHQVDFTPIEVYYSPYQGQQAMDRIIEMIDNAQFEVQFMIFAFTHDEMDTALIRAAKRGVLVRGIHDSTFIRGTSEEAPRLYSAGLNIPTGPFIKEDGNEHTAVPGLKSHGGKLHTKTIIVDRTIVATGSFNWSGNAVENNDENMVVITNPLVAREIVQQWQEIWDVGTPITRQLRHPSGDVASPGEVVISEIMWAGSYEGTTYNSTDDWIELYNTTNRDIDISHWGITWDPSENKIYPIPDEFNWFKDGVASRHYGPGRLIIPAKGYFLLKGQNKGIDTSDNKISGTKDFDLNSSALFVRLYDGTMNLIDQAGTGDPPFAGKVDSVNRRTFSMERFFYPAGHPQAGQALPGTSPGSWYTSNGNMGLSTNASDLCDNINLTFRAPCGTGQVDDSYKKGTVATPNYSGNSTSPAAPSSAAGGINALLNTPQIAFSTGTRTVTIQMRWAMRDTPRVTSSTCGGGDCTVSLDSNDTSLLLVTTTSDLNAGTTYAFSVQGGAGENKIDATGGFIHGGLIGVEGHGSNPANLLITQVWPAQSSSEDKVELTATSSGTLHNLGVYYYDFFSPTPILLYRMQDVQITAGQKVLLTLDKAGTFSDDRIRQDDCEVNSGNCFAGSTYNINANTAGQYDVFSDVPGIISSDGIVFIAYNLTATPMDLVCYTNRDGDIPEGLMTGGFRTMFNQGSSVWNLSFLPVDSFNDKDVQNTCVSFEDGSNNDYIQRSGTTDTNSASDFSCTGC